MTMTIPPITINILIPDNGKLDQCLALLQTLVTQGKAEMAVLDDLTTQVAANTTVEASAVTLIQGLAAQLAAAGTDPAKLQALKDSLSVSATALAAAVTANTPAAPPAPAPAPVPTP